jgi:hypothetical protein
MTLNQRKVLRDFKTNHYRFPRTTREAFPSSHPWAVEATPSGDWAVGIATVVAGGALLTLLLAGLL